MRIKGKITSWNDDQGFGFIESGAAGKNIFLHRKALCNRNRRPEINQWVSYRLSTDKLGRPCATQAVLAGEQLPQKQPRSAGSGSLLVAAIFLLIATAAVASARLPALMLGLYLLASLITFVVYAVDKSAAKRGAWRTQERTLHLLALLGGWPGALIAQQTLRHKSNKASFRALFWVTVGLNGAGFAWLLTPSGAATLQAVIAMAG